MIRKTKWIENSDSDDPVDEVARHALEGRLDFVGHYLSRAAADFRQPEDVHQLRVATRRAMAALEIFQELLPHRRAKKMDKLLKRIRRAAGDARDLDVLAARLKKNPPSADADRNAKLQQFIGRLRGAAQPAIEKLNHHLWEKQRFVRQARALVARIRVRSHDESPEAQTFAAAARPGLSALADEFFAAAAADLSQSDALHALRISGKRLRYAIEIFVGAFGPEMRQQVYPIVAEIQDKLGKIIDHVAAARLYSGCLERVEDPDVADLLRTLIADERQAIEQGRADFLAWWTAERADDLRHRFDDQFAPHLYGHSA